MKQFGTGPTLAEFSPWLKDPDERHRRILEVVERDSIIEGFFPFREETRARIVEELRSLRVYPKSRMSVKFSSVLSLTSS